MFEVGYSQTNNCAFYTSVGTSSSGSSGIGPGGCNSFPGMVPTGVPVAWSGTTCAGTIVSTIVGPPVTCMTLTYSSVNTNDYATISTNTGGVLTLSGVNLGINGNVIGPYSCSGSYGTVQLTVCSSVPFSTVTLLNTGCTSGWVINCSDQSACVGSNCSVPCLITNLTASIGACVPPSSYSSTGMVEFTDQPTTGQLIVEDCNGNQDVFNAPFTSPINYSITGQTADGGPCDITAYFTADLACTQTVAYTAPICNCNIDLFNASIGLCDQNTDTYCMSGDVSFTSPPAGGTLIVEVDNGTTIYDTIINPAFVSGQTWSICGIPSDGSASTVTVYFSNDPGCTSTIAYTAPTSCACDAEIGTFTANITGSSNNNYVLCFGDQININTNNDWVGPGEMFNPPGPPYTPGVSWLMYSCPPTVALTPDPLNTVPSDPCFIGLVSNTNFADINDLFYINGYPPGTFTNNTIYFVPITMYDQIGGTYSYVNGTIPCYELGAPYAIQYLPDFTFSNVDDCLAGTATVTVNGGLPAIDGSNFTASNLLPATASFANTTATDGGTIVINGLVGGDIYSFDVVDANGCPYTVTGGPFPPLEDPGFNYPASSWCTTEAPANVNITGVAGGTFASTPAGLTLNTGTGQITPSTSTPGTYDITYTTPGACFDDSTITVSIAATPTVDPIADQTVCDGDNFVAINFTGSVGTTFNWANDNTAIGLGASGTGNIAAFAGTAPTVQTVGNIVVTPVAGTCTGATESFTLTVNPQEDATFNYTGSPWCTTDAAQNSTVTGTPGGTYAAVPAGLTINAASGQITPGTSTPGTYDVTYTTSGICFASSTVSVTIDPLPTVDPVADETVCVGSNFTAVNFTGTGTTFDWTNDNVLIGLAANGTGNIASFTGATSGGAEVGNFVVTPSTANCVGNTETFTLTVNDLDDASYAYNNGLTYCQTAADPINNITGITGGTFSYTVVSGGPTLSLNAATGDVVLATSDLGVYDITYNTAGGVGSLCPNTLTLQFVITASPAADFTLDIYCANDADPLPAYFNGGSGGTFSAIPAGLVINAGNGQVDLGASTPGTYTVNNSINVAGCAIGTYDDDITIFEVPDANITGTTTICSGDPLPDVAINMTAGAANWDVTYNFNGAPTTVNTAANPYVITGAALGTYDIIAITDANGCSTPLGGQVIIDEYQTPSMAVVNQEICEASNLLIQTFTSTPAGSTFDWTADLDVGFGLVGSGDIGSFTGVNGTPVAVVSTVTVTPTSAQGCVGLPVNFTVTVNPLPVVTFTGPAQGCEPLVVEFTNTTATAGQNCIWTFGNGVTANGCTSVTSTYDAGIYDVSLTVTTAEGCTASDTQVGIIEVYQLPEASFSFSPQEIEVDDTEVEFTNASLFATSYEWDFADNSAMSTVEHPIHLFPQTPAEYLVTLWAYNGVCEDSVQQLIIIKDILLFYVPNIFTPDGDDYNEIFFPVFTSGFDKFDYHLTIFNRWGEIIFESYDADYGWDGHYGDGGLVKDDVYIWQIEFGETMSDKQHTHRGHVTVLK